MLDEYLVQQCQLITTTKDAFGDYTRTGSTTLNCRWRDIPTTTRQPHLETNDADSMVWFAADVSVTKGSILLFESLYYQVERVTVARRLGETDIQFLKCDVRVINPGIS